MDCSLKLDNSSRDPLVVKLESYKSANITCPAADSNPVKVIPFEGEERRMEHNPTILHGSNFTEGRYYCSHCPEAAIIAIKEAPSVEIKQSCSSGALRLDCEVNGQRFSEIDFDLRLTAEKPNGNWPLLKTGTNTVSINETELPDYAKKVACSLKYFNIDGTDYRLHNFNSRNEYTVVPCQPTPTLTQETPRCSNTPAVPSSTSTHSPQVIAATTMGVSLLLLLAIIVIIVILVLIVKRINRSRNRVSSENLENPSSNSDKPAVGPSPTSQVRHEC